MRDYDSEIKEIKNRKDRSDSEWFRDDCDRDIAVLERSKYEAELCRRIEAGDKNAIDLLNSLYNRN